MLAPVFVAIAIVAVYPLGYLVASAFSTSSLGRPFTDWVGFENFADLLGDGVTLPSLGRSLLFAIPSTLVAHIVGFVVALALDAAVKSGRIVRVVLLLPLMTPPVMVAVIWKLMLAPTGGLLNNIGQTLAPGSDPFLFLGSTPAAMISIIVVDSWQWTPLCVLLLYAALQTLPTEVYEAAQVDGAGVWPTFWKITFPLILPTIATVLVLKLILSFKVFDLVFIMTSGGPGFDTTVSSYSIYRTALQTFDVGAAAAQTIAFLVLVTIIIVPLNAVRQRLNRES
jgi:multiple sugar transport system permease protein